MTDRVSAERCAECARQERLLGADPTEEWVADAWAQATPHPHPDRAFADGYRRGWEDARGQWIEHGKVGTPPDRIATETSE